jgi:hypothetical protein
MKKVYLVIIICCVYCGNAIFAQVSQGGIPLFLEQSLLRSFSGIEWIEMPPFNLDSVRQIDELNRQNMRQSLQFAHKFYTCIEKGKQGTSRVLADGTKVWQVGVSSKNAYSINLLFTKFHVPEGGKLFIYNADHSHVIGAFDHRNNSPGQILPVRPVAGDALIIEYSESADAAFEGELLIGEVNHDYCDILRAMEPDIDTENLSCMPDVLCANADRRIIRSTVLLMINGNLMCTGTLVNNTSNDETPYLLTAVHCLNHNFQITNPNYANIAGTVIAFFNYDRPACGTQMKATEEMSLAGTQPQAIIERKDVALLKFNERPPVHYNAYYAGWNMLVDNTSPSPPYTNIHHPQGAVKKYGLSTKNLYLYTWGAQFDEEAHLEVESWDIGATDVGSSGSPLFDKDYRIVGTLTGGCSYCLTQPANCKDEADYFTALYKSWPDYLKTYLDPATTNMLQYNGYDPHDQNPLVRVSNADYINGDSLIRSELPGGEYLFGNNSWNLGEVAEEFNLNQTNEILGVYVLIPPMPAFSHTAGVNIKIYGGTTHPETLLGQKAFIPKYLIYNTNNNSFTENNKTLSVPTETFVAFDSPIHVNRKFFVAYTINQSSGNQFCAYNTLFASPGKANTAWIMSNQQWAEVTSAGLQATSLALHPLVRQTTGEAVEKFLPETVGNWHYDRSSGKLSSNSETESAGVIFVYTVNGQLIEQISFSKGEKSFKIPICSKGSVGIVKVVQENKVISKKILY